ncbi:MAG: hypothetical protein COA52_02360 [Hyphomicrobiales bacterium]|nr:MAG: hypothetical protein COA52_02360 [Hyphomicrobiales bacterium]
MAIRYGWAWMLFYLIGSLWMQFQAQLLAATSAERYPEQPIETSILPFDWYELIFWVIVSVGFASIAINWHNFILRGKVGAARFSVQQLGIILAYSWRSLKISVLALLFAIPAIIAGKYASLLLLEIMSGRYDTYSSVIFSVSVIVIFLIVDVVFNWILLRLCLVLPAFAVGNHITLKQSFYLTAGSSRALFVTALFIALLNKLPMLHMHLGFFLPNLIANPLGLMHGLFMIYIGISVITVLYGQIVEGRSL